MSEKKEYTKIKNIGLLIIYFCLGAISGYYFFQVNYNPTQEVDINQLHEKDFINEVTAFTEGVLISKDNQKLKIDSGIRGVSSFKFKKGLSVNKIDEGDMIRVEFIFDFENEEFLINKINKI